MAWTGSLGTGVAYDMDCGSIYLMGGDATSASDGPFQRTYTNLPAHQSITFTFDVYIIDAAGGEAVIYHTGYPGNEQENSFNPFVVEDNSVLTTSICGSGGVNDLGPVTALQFQTHTDSTLIFTLEVTSNNVGIRNLRILIQPTDVSTDPMISFCSMADPTAAIASYLCDCPLGEYLSGSCTACDGSCSNCFDAGDTNCFACADLYYFDGTSCLPCDSTCTTCYGAASNTCYSCIDEYYFDGVSSCLQCDSSCETCSGAGPSACLTCPWGASADANSQCILVCDASCDTCYNTDAASCYTCNDGYYFDGTSSCPQCDSSCETCSGAGASACLTCPWGDPADANSQCILVCDSACATCYDTDADSCYTCNDGYYFDGVSSCLQCHSSCETCSGAGASACLTCSWGAADANSQCACDAACDTCYNTDAASCYTCNDGYYFDGTSSCLSCNSTCKTCSGPGSNECLTCSWGPADANSECVTPSEPTVSTSTKTITDVKGQTQNIVGAGLIVNTILNAGGSNAIRVSMLAQMIQYIKYIDVDYPDDLQYAISTWDGDFMNFNSGSLDLTPSSFEHYGSSYGPLPSPITMYDYDIDSSFLMNFWDQLIPIYFICAVLIFMRFLEVIVTKRAQSKLTKKIMRQLRIGVQGLLITYLYNDFGDIFFFAILSFRTTKKATALTIMNILVSVLFIALAIGALIGQTWLIKRYQTLKEKDHEEFEKFQTKIEGAKIIWKEFKLDSFIHMNALFFTVLHSILFCIILATLPEHPTAQVILINLLSIAILTYLLWFRPFHEKHELIQSVTCEAILFAVNLCLLVLVFADSNSSSRDSVGQTILVLTLIFNFVPLFFLGVTLVIVLIQISKAYKAYKLKRRLDKLRQSVLHIKKNQIAPLRLPDDVSTKYGTGTPELYRTHSLLAIGQQSSGGTALIFPESPDHGPSLLSPSSKPTLHLVGMSDHYDQFIKAEDSCDSGKFSRATLLARNQKNIMRHRSYLRSRKSTFNIDADNLAE